MKKLLTLILITCLVVSVSDFASAQLPLDPTPAITALLPSADVSASAHAVSDAAYHAMINNNFVAGGLNKKAKLNWVNNHPLALVLTALAVMAAVQSLSDGSNAATDAGISAAASCSGSSCTTDVGTSGASTLGPSSLENAAVIAEDKKIIADAGANGVTYDGAGGVRTPNGSVKSSQISKAGFEAAGLSGDDAQKAVDAIAAARAAADKKAIALRGGGFDSESSDSPAPFKSAEANFDFMKGLRGKSAVKATVAGLSRKIASGESIGVSGDNIFEMVKRRYTSQRQQGNFINH